MNKKLLNTYIGSKIKIDEKNPFTKKFDPYFQEYYLNPNFRMRRKYILYLQDKNHCEDFNRIREKLLYIQNSIIFDQNYKNSNEHIYDIIYILKLIQSYHIKNDKLKYEILRPKFDFKNSIIDIDLIDASTSFSKIDYQLYKKDINIRISNMINLFLNILKK